MPSDEPPVIRLWHFPFGAMVVKEFTNGEVLISVCDPLFDEFEGPLPG